ncbi:MAG TPA: SRPBCC domain-containing protein [Candidatus Dormibacteraeota bacterium]
MAPDLASQIQPARRKVRIERTFIAALEEVWELWTTTDGIESWWGPDGFEVKVRKLDIRPGGELLYDMTAIAPDQIDFMKKAGMPLTTPSSITYTEVVPPKRLAFTQLADFIPNVKPYRVAMTVEFDATPAGVRMLLTLDAMHDEYWTKMAVMGWENELDKLAKLLKPV